MSNDVRFVIENVIRALDDHTPTSNEAWKKSALKALRGYLDHKFETIDEAFQSITKQDKPIYTEEYKQTIVNETLELHDDHNISYSEIPDKLLHEQDYDLITDRTVRQWRNEEAVPELEGMGKRTAIYRINKKIEELD